MADIPGNISSTVGFELTPGYQLGSFTGELETFGDVDYIRVNLTAGQSYNFYGVVTSAGTSGDGFISLYDSSGALIESNDDGGTGLNSFLTFNAAESGDYFIGVRTYGGPNGEPGLAGSYQLNYALNNAVERQLTDSVDNYQGNVANERITAGAGDDVVTLGLARDAFGDQGDDFITGNAQSNFLSGGLGNDTIYGGGGFDNIFGDSGSDSLIGGNDAEVIRGGTGYDFISGNGGSDTLYGNEDADYISGGAGNDLLDGGSGADRMFGESGDDRYVVDNVADYVDETGGSGVDVVRSSVGYSLVESDRLKGDVENLQLTGTSDISGRGNSLNNTITGNSGANEIRGGSGMDFLFGGDGADGLFGENNSDTIDGGAGNDYIRGGTAGTGEDRMTGGSGNDRFVFASALEVSTLDFTDRDIISDFTHRQDRIDFSGIDADGGGGTNTAFSFRPVEASSFTGVKGQLIWDNLGTTSGGTARTVISADINGDRQADFQLELTGHHNMTSADFFL